MNYLELVKLINHHNHLYYDLNAPELTDGRYDQLYDLLEKTEAGQGWRDTDSPTIKVGGASGKIKHKYKLYSLNKVYDKKEINPDFIIETPKIDGTNLTLTYENGKLLTALTRGDGEFGESINHLVCNIKGVPETIFGTADVTVTGECVTDNKDIENFRNYVSGALGLKSSVEIKDRNIRYIVHDMLDTKLSYQARMEFAKNLGFYTVLDSELCNNYPQDGVVYRVNARKDEIRLGYTSKFPKFAVALKAREESTAITTLQAVEWGVGRTGVVVPVGILKPVVLDDATISRLTLHNIEFIETHNLGLGDYVEIERAGGVIPKMLRVIQHSNHNQKITEQDASTAIGGEVYRNGPKLFAKNPEQHGTVKLLAHFISTLGIKGIGSQSIIKLGITHPVDLFSEETDYSILGANGVKVKAEVERAKTKPYDVVLAALGIEGVGKTASKKIVQKIPYFSRLKEIEYTEVPFIGPVIKEKILAWLEINEDWVLTLPLQLQADANAISIEPEVERTKVCISGKMDMTKNELETILESHGYEVISSVSKKCNILISDGKKSSKWKTAEKYGIKILNYFDQKDKIINGLLE